ncbi:MAG: TetR/AcrR family transcriptional regulator [Christensenellaceae bacterium]|nr:TetR/AcrR family transcriptional regulator [Christensenellaceae bacterium]
MRLIKESRIKNQTKHNFMQAFLDLYLENSKQKISVKSITEKAGYNRGTFYNYFNDVEDLRTAIENELIPDEKDFELIRDLIKNDPKKSLDHMFTLLKAKSDALLYMINKEGNMELFNKILNNIKPQLKKTISPDKSLSEKEIDFILEIYIIILITSLKFVNIHAKNDIEKLRTPVCNILENGVLRYLYTNEYDN